MQRDLDRLRKRKRLLQRVLAVAALTFALAFVLVAIKSCGERFGDTYNKEYRPLDTERQPSQKGE